MARHDDAQRLRHMLDHAIEAVDLCAGLTREDLDRDRKLNLALVRLVEIIGEAANRVSPEGRARCAAVPWSSIIGMRNRLIHGYDGVDFDILWAVVRDDLPSLIAALREALRD